LTASARTPDARALLEHAIEARVDRHPVADRDRVADHGEAEHAGVLGELVIAIAIAARVVAAAPGA
jgi:hypothetical protein